MRKEQVLQQIEESKIIAIIRGIQLEQAIPIVEALKEGGIEIIEFAIDHNAKNPAVENADRIRCCRNQFSDHIFIGAGSVITKEEAQIMMEAGAEHIVSPNTKEDVIRYCNEKELVSIPGAMTATEAVHAYESGADYVKLFPAGELGYPYVKALRAPLCHIPFLLVGGISLENMANFLAIGVNGFGLGSNLVSAKATRMHDYATIQASARAYTNTIESYKNK